jgi:hypothetical protein
MIPKVRSVPRWCALAVFAVAVFVGSVALAEEEEGTTVTISGEIEVAEYDDDGNAAALMVYDQEWGSVLVAAGGKGDELMEHVGEIASLKGKLTELDEDSDYDYSIRVTSYTFGEPEEPDTSEDWDSDES